VAGPYHLVPVLDACSRKITGRYFGPEETSSAVQIAWDKALAEEGLLAEDAPRLPAAASDRGTQMTSKSTQQFFFDLKSCRASLERERRPTTLRVRRGSRRSSANASTTRTPRR
jgi:transposase InsO family protein